MGWKLFVFLSSPKRLMSDTVLLVARPFAEKYDTQSRICGTAMSKTETPKCLKIGRAQPRFARRSDASRNSSTTLVENALHDNCVNPSTEFETDRLQRSGLPETM